MYLGFGTRRDDTPEEEERRKREEEAEHKEREERFKKDMYVYQRYGLLPKNDYRPREMNKYEQEDYSRDY